MPARKHTAITSEHGLVYVVHGANSGTIRASSVAIQSASINMSLSKDFKLGLLRGRDMSRSRFDGVRAVHGNVSWRKMRKLGRVRPISNDHYFAHPTGVKKKGYLF